jgi:ribonucleoside-diphosphate reductase alpha chain
MGLKTTYYLRTLAASQVEKSTLDAGRFGFTQTREYATPPAGAGAPATAPAAAPAAVAADPLCRIDDPDCEACQ